MKLMVVKDRNVLNTKFLAQFVNSLADIGYDIDLVCDSYSKPGQGVKIDERINFYNLNAKTKNPFINAVRYLKEKLFISAFRFNKFIKESKPDAIICYFPIDLFNVGFMQNHDIPVILMIHGYPPMVFKKYKKKKCFKKKIWNKLFDKVDVYQVLMKSYEKEIENIKKGQRVVHIPNEVVQVAPEDMADLSVEKKKIIYVARVEKEGKRQHLLVKAFAKAGEEFKDWRLEFWGLQKYKKYNEDLMELAKKYGIEKNVFIMGYAQNIQEVYKGADIHAFPSLHEGFSLALADGMAMGLPSIGFSDAKSVNELIVDGHNGFLVDSVDEFAEKLKKLMIDQDLRIKFGKNAVEDMKQYKPEIIISMWDNLLKSLDKKN